MKYSNKDIRETDIKQSIFYFYRHLWNKAFSKQRCIIFLIYCTGSGIMITLAIAQQQRKTDHGLG